MTAALKELTRADLIERIIVEHAFPPATLYRPNTRRPLVTQLIRTLLLAPDSI
jgi:hypothetical protein